MFYLPLVPEHYVSHILMKCVKEHGINLVLQVKFSGVCVLGSVVNV